MLGQVLDHRVSGSQGNPLTLPSSGPWVLIDIDFQDACEYFSKSVAIFGNRGFKKRVQSACCQLLIA